MGMPSAKVAAIVREKMKREALPKAVAAYVARLFPQQLAFLRSPSKRKVVHAGRRGGKTHVLIAEALESAVAHPGQTIPVVERTLSCQAANAFWSELQNVDAEFDLGTVFQHTMRVATFSNGAQIALMGADTAEAADKVRGGKYPKVIIDEAGTFRPHILEYLVDDCAEPATMDFDGVIILAGTPNPVRRGMFYDAATNGQWDVHHWTSVDNLALPIGALQGASEAERRAWRVEWLAALRARKGWTETSGKYVREYLGLWTDQFEDQLYEMDAARNIIPALPACPADAWRYVLGIDVGFNDPCALVVWGRRMDGDPNLYVIESYEQAKLIPSALAAHVERLKSRYTFVRIVCDTGGLGKGYAEEMIQTYGLAITPAAKAGKLGNIEYTNGDLRTGRIKILRGGNAQLIADLAELKWNDDQTDASDEQDDHLPDAFLYGHGAIRTWAREDPGEREAVRAGSPEWHAAVERSLELALEMEAAPSSDEDGADWRDAWRGNAYGD